MPRCRGGWRGRWLSWGLRSPCSPLGRLSSCRRRLTRSNNRGPQMRSAYITAGAAGMYCGSCMRDNPLVAALARQGHEALLIPTYTPIRTDELDVSQKRVFFGGINVYLQQKFGFFRHTPWFL